MRCWELPGPSCDKPETSLDAAGCPWADTSYPMRSAARGSSRPPRLPLSQLSPAPLTTTSVTAPTYPLPPLPPPPHASS